MIRTTWRLESSCLALVLLACSGGADVQAPSPLGGSDVSSGASSGSSGSSGTGAVGATASSGAGGTSSLGTGGSIALDPSPGTGGTGSPPREEGAEDGSSSDPGEGEGVPVPSPADPAGPGQGSVQAGTLTAGAWDDNQNFDFFSAYRRSLIKAQQPGLLPFDTEEYESAHAQFAESSGPKDKLDIALVVDTTGSMGDEIGYLQAEFTAIAKAIDLGHPNTEQRWSLVLYRDEGDEYVVRAFGFSTDRQTFSQQLAAQAAGGGGDFPEAPDQALQALTELDWDAGEATARLAFWVADAPNHAENAEDMATAIRDVSSLGIHVYPVASSGIDELTELTMRSAAQLTGGRYLFLTDDSGVGGPHKEPTIPCYFVTKLDTAIVRMVDIELSGEYREPAAAEIIRTGGDPKSGACELGSGDEVLVF